MVDVPQNWFNWFNFLFFLFLEEGLLVIQILHDFSVTIPRCYNDVYVNSFFSCTARIWNSLLVECFPLTYDLSGFKSRINRHLLKVTSAIKHGNTAEEIITYAHRSLLFIIKA